MRDWLSGRRLSLALACAAGALFLYLIAPTSDGAEAPGTQPATQKAIVPAAKGATADGGIPAELQEAIKSLATADDEAREKVYALIAAKGDARLVPAIRAFKEGKLQNRDGRLVIYGDKTEVPGKGKVFPLIDAFAGTPLKNADGSPVTEDAISLSAPGMMRLSPVKRNEHNKVVPELLAFLSLLDPDEARRVQSITDVGDKANLAIPSAAVQRNLIESLALAKVTLQERQAQAAAVPVPADVAGGMRAVLDAMGPVEKEEADNRAAHKLAPLHISQLASAVAQLKTAADKVKLNPAEPGPYDPLATAVAGYQEEQNQQPKAAEEVKKVLPILKTHLEKEPTEKFKRYLRETIARIEAAVGDRPAQLAAVAALGTAGTERAGGTLARLLDLADYTRDGELESAARAASAKVDSYQRKIRWVNNTFFGLSQGSILVLLALGLSITFGLMGVINMAQGEFMMIGAFTTYVVSQWFNDHAPGAFDYYLWAAIPLAFLVSAFIGWFWEVLVIRHLYGRPLETLLATWGIGLIMIQAVRGQFGDSLSVKPPGWIVGSYELMPDLNFAKNRLFIIALCGGCIFLVYFIVNRTKLGLLLRATTQNRPMAQALGVPTRRVDSFTFALGAGLAGIAGVAVPLFDKINPNIGKGYIVDSFMVVVVGGVGKLAGVIWAGLGLGFLSKYLEPVLQMVPSMSSSASVLGRVLVLAMIVAFLQRKPSGLFPPKGRLADA